MSEQQYAYPFDPTGQASGNLIQNERHVINPQTTTTIISLCLWLVRSLKKT